MSDFPAVAARWMDERGMTVTVLASAVGRDKGYVSKVLRGQKPAGHDIARRIDDALGADGEIIAAAGRPRLVPENDVPQELADYFAAQLNAHYRADRYLGSGKLLGVVGEQDKVLKDVTTGSSARQRSGMWSLSAGFAGLLGWLHQDVGNLDHASSWHDTMIDRAHQTADEQMIAFSVHCKALLLADLGDGRGCLDLAGSALTGRRRLAPRVQVLLLQQYAHGLALAEGRRAAAKCSRLLDEAEGLLDLADDGRPWGGQVTVPGYITIQRATIATRLGRHQQALSLWDEVIPATGPGRDLGVFAARQARAYADAGEPEQAVETALPVIQLATSTQSARMRTELATVREAMAPWRRDKPGRALDVALATLPRQRGR